MSYWSSKQAHGFPTWGFYIKKKDVPEDDHRIIFENFEPCDDISKTDGSRMLVKFGNEFGPKCNRPFQHPKNCPHDNWYHWDNPELPQFLWKFGHNPTGAKDWIRWIKGDMLTQGQQFENVDHEHRINRILSKLTTGLTKDWKTIIQIHACQVSRPKHALLCPVTAPNFVHYYATTQQDWIKKVSKGLERQGYTWEVRQKPGRAQRMNNQLTDQLLTGQYGITVSQHSVAAMESAIAGIPPVVTGPHPTGMLGTPWVEFELGNVRPIYKSDVEDRCRLLLGSIRHKKEIFTGEWQ